MIMTIKRLTGLIEYVTELKHLLHLKATLILNLCYALMETFQILRLQE